MVAACGLWAYVSAHEGLHRIEHLYVLQHAGIHFALGFVFATTLRPGATPLISAFAVRVHRTITPELLRYTRQVTWAWSLYFARDGGVVARAVRRGAVVVVVGVRQPGDAGGRGIALFVGEYLLRYRLHPEFERITLAQALQAYRDTPLIEARRP